MGNLNLSIVKPLTRLAQDFKSSEFIADLILKPVPLNEESARIPVHSKDSLRVPINTERTPKGKVAQLEASGMSYIDVQTEFHALQDIIDITEKEQAAEIGMNRQRAVMQNLVMNLKNSYEKRIADLLQDLNTYNAGHKETVTSTDQWSHADSDPYEQIMDGHQAIRNDIYRKANTLMLSYDALKTAIKNEKLLAKLSTQRDQILTVQDLARIFEVEKLIIGSGQWFDDVAGETKQYWNDCAILAYVPTNATVSEVSPGYNFYRSGYPKVKRWDSEDGNQTTIQVEMRNKGIVTLPDAMYIIKDLTA